MVIAFGEILWDILPSGKKLGGAVANCAYRLHQLGTPVSLVSRIGRDELGTEIKNVLNDKGLPYSLLQEDTKYPTGTVDVTISDEGEADYVINKEVSYDYIECTEELLQTAAKSKAIVFGNLIQRNQASRETLYQLIEAAPQALKIVDINLRKDCFTEETVRESLSRTDVLKLNDKEVKIVSDLLNLSSTKAEDFCEEIAEKLNVSTTLVSLGKNGVYAFDKSEGSVHINGYHNANVADTVGAGDNFTAGFVHQRLAGANLKEACSFANLIGAIVTTKVGGMPSLTSHDIEEYRSTNNVQQHAV